MRDSKKEQAAGVGMDPVTGGLSFVCDQRFPLAAHT
jgi:hypothetical protein